MSYTATWRAPCDSWGAICCSWVCIRCTRGRRHFNSYFFSIVDRQN